MFQVGQIVGNDFEILDLLGSGGMGYVFRARQRSLDRIVCLKVPREEVRADEAAMQRFEREAKTIAKLNHPNIVAIYIVHLPKDRAETPYIAMEFVEGKELEDFIYSARASLTVGDLLNILRQICDGLQAAHEANIIHRDIKPANILISNVRNTVKVMDFGIARVQSMADTATSTMVVGTPAFMSPEQVRGEKPTPASDIYALGAVLYVLCAQRPLFEGTATTVAIKQLTEMPRPPREFNNSIFPDLDKLILQCLQKDPGKRPSSARALAAELERVLSPFADQPLRALIPYTTDATNALATAAQGVTWYDPAAIRRAKLLAGFSCAAGIALLALFGVQVVWGEIAPWKRAEAARQLAAAKPDEAGKHIREAIVQYQAVLSHPMPVWLGFLDHDKDAQKALTDFAAQLKEDTRWKNLDESWNAWAKEMSDSSNPNRRSRTEVFASAQKAADEWRKLAPADSEMEAFSQILDQRLSLARRMMAVEADIKAERLDAADAGLLALEPFMADAPQYVASALKEVEKLRTQNAPVTPTPAPISATYYSSGPPPTPSLTPIPTAIPTPPPTPTPSPTATPALDPGVANQFMALLDAALLQGQGAPFFADRFASPDAAAQYRNFLARLSEKYEIKEAKHTMSGFRVEGDRGYWTGQFLLRGRLLANRLPTTIAQVPQVSVTLLWKEDRWLLVETDLPMDRIK